MRFLRGVFPQVSKQSVGTRVPCGNLFWNANSNLCLFCILVSLKRPSVMKEDVRTIKRVQSKIAEGNRYFKTLLSFGNLFKAGLIEYAKKTEREKEKKSKLPLKIFFHFEVSLCLVGCCSTSCFMSLLN